MANLSNSAPVRFDPRFPVFDTHDIAHLLKPGRNVVAVEVNHFGLHTFKSMPARAGMLAWGSVEMASGPGCPLRHWSRIVARHGVEGATRVMPRPSASR